MGKTNWVSPAYNEARRKGDATTSDYTNWRQFAENRQVMRGGVLVNIVDHNKAKGLVYHG